MPPCGDSLRVQVKDRSNEHKCDSSFTVADDQVIDLREIAKPITFDSIISSTYQKRVQL